MYENEVATLNSLLGKLDPNVSDFASMRSEIGKYKEGLLQKAEMGNVKNPERLKQDIKSIVARTSGVIEAYKKNNPEYFYCNI